MLEFRTKAIEYDDMSQPAKARGPARSSLRARPVPDDFNEKEPVAYQVIAHAKSYPSGAEIGFHSHDKAEFLYAVEGVMEVATTKCIWVNSPQRAAWIPPSANHCVKARSPLSVRNLYFPVDLCPLNFPTEPQVVNVSPLLRELVLRAMELPVDFRKDSFYRRILELILDEIKFTNDDPFFVPRLVDKRLVQIQSAILSNPSNNNTLDDWGAVVGASTRTLARLFRKETGSSFGQWRSQLRILSALPRLCAGENIAVIALDLGYETPSAFAAMFRRIMGTPPSEYAKARAAIN